VAFQDLTSIYMQLLMHMISIFKIVVNVDILTICWTVEVRRCDIVDMFNEKLIE
jgi:hypothetical protein